MAARKMRLLLLATTALTSLLVAPRFAHAGPNGGSVVAGSAAISQSGAATTITQSTNKAIINWQGFSIKSNESVTFNQPGASSVTLNRVTGPEASTIAGSLTANGQVFLVNPNGVLFSQGSSVNVGGIVASTLDISNANFLAGKYTFSGNSTASVVNQGSIAAASGGYVSLMGKTVSNSGTITANYGTVAMTAGSQITLNFEGNSLFDVTIDKGVMDALVENKQLIRADGGKVIMTAKAADAVLSAQVNNSGIVQARTMAALTGGGYTQGSIKLYAYGGKTKVSGTLDASAPKGGDGGTIETSGDQVSIADDAVITTAAALGNTGTWTLDPTDFTIAASGGDITGSLLSKELALTSVTFTTSMGASGTGGNLYVNDAVSWSAGTALTLIAANNLYVNSAITASGDNASLTLTATNGSLYANAPITMSGSYDTMALNANTSSGYVYVNDAITLSGNQNDALTISALNYVINSKASYSGTTTDSNGKVVAVTDTSGGTYGSINFTSSQGAASNNSLTINNNPYTLIYSMSQLDMLDGHNAATGVGAATAVSGYFAIANNLDASGTTYTGALIGTSSSTAFSGVLAGLGHAINGLTIKGTTYAGLIGYAKGTNANYTVLRDIGLTNVYIDAYNDVGSLAGYATYTNLDHDYATGTITSTNSSNTMAFAGGILGYAYYANVSYSYSNVDMVGPQAIGKSSNAIGGLVGSVVYRNISNSDATDDILCLNNCGGLVGSGNRINISNSYHIGNVTGYDLITGYSDGMPDGQLSGYVGGLAGSVSLATVTNSFANGDVSNGGATGGENAYVGGLIGNAVETAISNSWANANVTSEYGGGGGLVGTLSGGTTTDKDKSWNTTTSITDSYSSGTVTAQTTGVSGGSAGGLVGMATGGTNKTDTITITGSSSSANVTGITNNYHGGSAGGLIGTTGGTVVVSDSSASGNVSCVMCDAGGLIGTNNGTVTGSQASGNVSAGEYGLGAGLVGVNYGSITNSSSGGGTISGGMAGGLVGDNFGSISHSTASNNVVATKNNGALIGGYYYGGGLVAFNGPNGTITDSSASGDVTALHAGNEVGGIVGLNLGSVTNSSGTGSLTNNGASVDAAIGSSTGSYLGVSYTGTSANNSYVDVKAAAAAQAAAQQAAAQQAAAAQAAATQAAQAAAAQATAQQQAAATKAAAAQQAVAQAAAQAAAGQAAGRAGNEAISQTVQANQAPPTTLKQQPLTGAPSTAVPPPAPIDLTKQVKIDPSDAIPTPPEPKKPEEIRKRQVPASKSAARGSSHGADGGGLGAHIRSMEIDGRKFNLEKNGNVAPTAPAAPGAAPAGGQ